MRLKLLCAAMLVAAMGDRPPPPPSPLPETSVILRGAPGAPVPAPIPQAEAATLRVLSADSAAAADFVWQARPVVVFSDTAADPRFVQQLRQLQAAPGPLLARDVVVITDTDPAAASDWRRSLRPEGFSLVLIDKDGQVKLRKPAPWDSREITRAIDKFPSRLQEIGRAGLP